MDPASRSLKIIRALSGAADDVPRAVIRAYHGSPHSFSRFDASKIGTGEGMQTYGHGLYFAGSENVAKNYRDILSGQRDVYVGGRSAMDMSRSLATRTPEGDAWRALLAGAWGVDDVESLLAQARRYASDNPPERASAVNSAIDGLLQHNIVVGKQPGHMYEVELGVPEEALLDLDAPVTQQPAAIQEMLGSYGQAPSHFTFGQEGWRGSNALFRAKDNLGGSAADASRVLLERGIPGVRYFDGNSRAAADGARNYVMFPGTEDRIKILRQYGLLPPLVGAAAMQEE